MNAEDCGWTKENLQRLFAQMKRSIPRTYATWSYVKGQKHVDWNKVAFPPFSAEACQRKWKQILQKMRKQRSLTELILEAEDVLSNPVLNIKIHPDLPKRPPPPSALFYEENWVKIKEQHPELRHQELVAAIGKKYRELPDKNKALYVKKYQLAYHEYREKTKIFGEKHLSLPVIEEGRDQSNERAEGLPPKPPINGYKIFCKEQLETMASVSHRDYMKVWAQRWRELTERQRKEYSERCQELKRTFTIKLQKYIKTLNEEEQKRILHENAMYITKEVLRRSGEPETSSGCRNEEERHKNTAQEDVIDYSRDVQQWLKVCQDRPSDSEDEDIEDSSSDEEEDYLDSDEEEEEEEEEDGDITFDLF